MENKTELKSQPERSRLLQVYETVVRFGPISLDCAFPLVKRSRSATFRALKTLEISGWIRRTLNGHQYVATATIDELSEQGTVSLPELDSLCLILRECRKQHRLQMQVGFYITNRTFHLVECSESELRTDLELRPDQACIAGVAFSLLPKARRDKILRDMIGQIDLITCEQIRAQVIHYNAQLIENQYVLEACGRTAYIGLKSPAGQYGALSLTVRPGASTHSINKHAKAITHILQQNNFIPRESAL
ncbi:hypothetical protein [Ruegeria atlantica]|uniref:hypothetical protein n=1 Tax=Ruegeria atlantica TaxID=81569 RepID=UPI00148133A1|nr:hypothetical protein [Ruegeria atlantica]